MRTRRLPKLPHPPAALTAPDAGPDAADNTGFVLWWHHVCCQLQDAASHLTEVAAALHKDDALARQLFHDDPGLVVAEVAEEIRHAASQLSANMPRMTPTTATPDEVTRVIWPGR